MVTEFTRAEQLEIAYHAMMAADRHLSAALQHKFGAAAGDKRYQPQVYRDFPHLATFADQAGRAYDAWETLSRQGSK